ncbi:MAG: hypothetical protein KC476_06905, partial [Cyanobacteria bacterium HKST-UBA06]|nr:hypothetical protein [Cyanobacteria bacterium HKST-UBA06]
MPIWINPDTASLNTLAVNKKHHLLTVFGSETAKATVFSGFTMVTKSRRSSPLQAIMAAQLVLTRTANKAQRKLDKPLRVRIKE